MKNEGPTPHWVMERVQKDILSGRYRPGEPLAEVKLAQELGVSRTPVREALRQLASDGLVIIEPNRGVFVRGIGEQDVFDAYMIRSELESLAVRWAVERMDDTDHNELLGLADLMEFHAGRGEYDKLAGLDIRFHEMLYHHAKSEMLQRTLESVLLFVQQARSVSLHTPQRAAEVVAEHLCIAKAVKQRDVEEAVLLMEQHIAHAYAHIREQMKGL